MVVSIVDGQDALPQPYFITDDLNVSQKMDKYEEEYAKENLEIMDCHEGAMLMMQSLRRKKPVDDWRNTHTITYFNRKHIKGASHVSRGFWYSTVNEVEVVFSSFHASKNFEGLRCRPSAKVMEI